MPVILHTRTASGVEIALWQITEDEHTFLSLVPDAVAEAAYLRGIASNRRHLEYLATRALLATLVGPSYRIDHEASGRPFLICMEQTVGAMERSAHLPPSAMREISISHTEGYVAIILSDSRPVAIDIERRAPRALRLASRFLTEKELDAFSTETFATLAWSVKETLFKRIPVSNVDFRDALHLEAPNYCDTINADSDGIAKSNRISGFIPASVDHPDYHGTYDVYFRVAQDYVLTWID